jgi:hypothetical protein
MAELTFELLGGDPKNVDRGFLEMLLSAKSKDSRETMLREAINGPSSDGVLFTVERGAHLKKIADYYLEQGYEVRIDGVPYYGN